MIVIELSPTSSAFRPGLGLEVQVRLFNDGAPAEIPNPAALRASPSWRLSPWTDEAEPHAASRVFGNAQGYAPAPGQPERLTLGTGAAWDGTVTIHHDNVQATPGEWALSLLLPVDGAIQESPSCRVRVAGWSITAAHAGFGVPALERQDGDALLVQGTAASTVLYRMPWQENDSDRTGHGGAEPIPLLSVDPSATDPLVPVRNGPFFADPARWLLWREGATVRAFGTAGEQHALVLPMPPAALLRPALQRTGDDVLVFALSGDRRRLDRLRFPRGSAGTPILEHAFELPMTVSAGTAAFAPEGSVLIGLSAATPEGTALVMIDGSGAAPTQVAVLPAATPVADAAPAVMVHPDGSVVVGALVSTDTGFAVAEAHFTPGPAGTPVVASRPLGPQEAPAIGGALLYAAPHEGDTPEEAAHAPSVCVVLRLADGTLLRLGSHGTLHPTTYEAPPVLPLTLVPSTHGALLLCCDPLLGPFMAEA